MSLGSRVEGLRACHVESTIKLLLQRMFETLRADMAHAL